MWRGASSIASLGMQRAHLSLQFVDSLDVAHQDRDREHVQVEVQAQLGLPILMLVVVVALVVWVVKQQKK